jgi:PAS domain S-box-containing protein
MSDAGTIRVLHVDDEPDLADMVATFLEREDDRIAVQTANSPPTGLELLREHDVDCIVSDYDMPAQNGIEFLDAVREEYSELPFILYTGKGSEEIASEAISAGVTDYLQKESGTGQYPILANRICNAVEQYRSRQAVQETERKLSELAERTDDLLFMFDDDWSELLFANSAYEEIWGGSIEELEQNPSSFLENVRLDDREKVRTSMERLSNGESSQLEYRIVRRDGEQRWVRADAQPILDENGNVVRIVGQVRDITERKERELQLETIIDNLPGYVYRHEHDSGYPLEFVKGDAETVTGYTTTELEEDVRLAEEIIHPDDQEALWEEHIKELAAMGQFDSTYRIISKDGDTRWIRDQGQLIEDPVTGKEVVDGFTTDVSDHIQRERELKRQQTFIDESLDALQDVFYAINTDGELIRWNDRVTEVSGYTREEIDEIDVTELFAEEHRDRVKNSIQETIETGASAIRADVLTAEGERIPYEFRETRLTDPNTGGAMAVGVGRDISSQIRREQDLERIRDFFTEAERLGNLGAWEFNADGDLVWTDGTRRIHEVDEDFAPTLEEALEFFHPDDRETIEQAVEDALQKGQSYELELRIITANGNQRWIRTGGEVVADAEPRTARGFIQDITDQKRREQQLHEKQAFIEQSLDTLDDIFYLVDTDGDFQRWNSTLPELTGYSDDAIGSMNALEFFEDEHREAISHSIHEILETGSHVTEAEITTADGRHILHEFKGVRMTDDDGEPTGIIGIARDITERKTRERQLEEKTEELEQLAAKFETQYRTLFEEAPVMTVLTRAKDGEPIIEDCNSQFAETLGYDEDAMIGSELADVYTPDSAEKLLEEGGYRRSLDGKFTKQKRELVTADGEIVEALLRAVPRRTVDGDIVGTVAMYIDITEREVVKRVNERLEEFTSVVSHDLRSPLSVANGRLELAREECDSEHLGHVEQALNWMETLIDDLLTLAREGREVTDPQPVDLAEMIDGCWETVETEEASLITDIDREVLADESRLKQVFENLFRNAVEHGGADVTVTVGELDDGFYIEDDGSGIPSSERDDIFETGYSGSEAGAGLGLSIVKRIVTAHGWAIRVTDGTDGGARFEITDVDFVPA